MKFFTNILILVLLFSCLNKESNKGNVENNFQQKEAVKEIDDFSENLLSRNLDTLSELANSPQIKTVYNRKEELKHTDTLKDSHKITDKKHKEIPPDGTYIYDISYAEWQGRSMGEKVKVVINGNTIKVIAIGKSSVGVNDGEVIDEGMLVKHNVTGDWLITNDPSDANLDAYGGCAGAPMVIDFTNRVYITC